MNTDPATKQDLENLRQDLKQWMLEREIASIRWFVGTQLTYVVLTIGAMYFLMQHMK